MTFDNTTKKTKSEILFERFCRENDINFASIPIAKKRMPDYKFYPAKKLIITEITQIDPNKDDKRYSEELKSKRFATVGGTVGSRVRQKITDKANQLRAHSRGQIPAILVLFNNTKVRSYTNPAHILAAMYGCDTYVFHVSKEPSQSISLANRKFGKGRGVTTKHNTSLSALGVLELADGDRLLLKVYHNVHARCPIDPTWLKTYSVEQFLLKPQILGQFQSWISG